MRSVWLGLVTVAVVGLFVTNSVLPSQWANEYVVSITATHGVERRDVPALLLAIVGVVGLIGLWADGRDER